jgi:hypothetical protein
MRSEIGVILTDDELWDLYLAATEKFAWRLCSSGVERLFGQIITSVSEEPLSYTLKTEADIIFEILSFKFMRCYRHATAVTINGQTRGQFTRTC